MMEKYKMEQILSNLFKDETSLEPTLLVWEEFGMNLFQYGLKVKSVRV